MGVNDVAVMDWVGVLEEKTKQLFDLWNRRKNEKD